MAIELSGSSGVIGPIWTTATRPSSPVAGQQGFNTTTGLMDLYNGTSWTSVGELQTIPIPKITNVQITNSSYTVLDDTAVDTSGGYIKITGTGFAASCQVLVNNVAATSTTFVSSTEVRAQIPATAAGTYTLYVVNTDGGVAIRVNGITFSAFPSWSTGSTLTEQESNSAISIQLSATSNSNITYQLAQGSSLPSGITLNSSGLLSGTTPTVQDPTVYSFSIIATDQENQDNSRTFSITITAASDQYFKNTVLLLPGNGTNATQNNTFIDSSGNNVSITRQGSSTQGSFSPYGSNWSNYFNNSTGLGISYGTATHTFWNSDFTIEFWINCSTENYGSIMASWFNVGFGSGSWGLQVVNGIISLGHIQSSMTDQGSFVTSGSTRVDDNQWHHVVVTQVTGANKTFRVFVDGILRGYKVENNWTQATANSTIYIGTQGPSTYDEGARHLTGYLSNLRLTTAIVAGYSTTSTTLGTTIFTPPTAALTAISGTNILVCQSNRFNDISNNNFTIVRNGDVTVQRFSPFNPGQEYSTATIGGSGYFAGYGNYLTFPVSTWTALAGVNTSFTVEAWVYRTAVDSQSGDICGTNVAGYTTAVSFTVNTNGALAFADWSGNGSHYTNTVTASGAVPLNAWTHVAASKSGNTMRLFVNGVLLATTTITVANISTLDGSPAIIAGRPAGATMFIGYISSLRIVQGTAVYTANFTPPTGPLSAISGTSLLLNFTNASIIDSTARNVLQTVGSAQISTSVSKFGSGSIWTGATSGSHCLSIPASSLLQMETANFTIEGWFRPDAVATGNERTFYIHGVNTTGGLAFFVGTGGVRFRANGQTDLAYSGTISSSVFTHIAFVRSGNTRTIYVNGTSVASDTLSFNNNDVTTIDIGAPAKNAADNFRFYGYIDDLRITKGIARYTSNFTPPTSALSVK